MYSPLDRSRPCPFPLSPMQTYLGEDADGYYVMDGFLDNVGNMFKRMVKFTPKSFTPGNIFKAVRNTTLTTMTGGIYLALPKSVKKTMENVANVALPVVAAGVAAAVVGPAVMSTIGPKLAQAGSFLGKNISTIGKGLFDVMGKLSPAQQSQVAQRVTAQDLVYAEQHQGQLPPQLMQYVDEVAQANYQPVMNAAQDPNKYFASSALYPGLQQATLDMQAGYLQQEQAGSWTSGEVAAAVGAGVMLAVLIGRK
jgi:hypothetical protein